jgi:uncharacterized protein YegL
MLPDDPQADAFCESRLRGKPQPEPFNDNIRIILVLDQSGSMRRHKQKVIECFNKWLQKQIHVSLGEANPPQFSLVNYDKKWSAQSWSNIRYANNALTVQNYIPHGGTALYDALACTLQKYRTERTNIVVIISDGEDRDSKHFTASSAKHKVDFLTQFSDWSFSFIGANVDVSQQSNSLGIASGNAISWDFSRQGLEKMFDDLTEVVNKARVDQAAKRF